MSYGASYSRSSLRGRSDLLYRVIQQRKAMLQSAMAHSQWRQTGVLRLQISRLVSRRYGLVRQAAAQNQRWAISTLAQMKAAAKMPQYRPIDLPRTNYRPWYSAFPQQAYANVQRFYPPPSYAPVRAGYHPYVKGQVGAQVPSHLSRFGIGDLSADDVEGVAEPIGLDGYGDLGMFGYDSANVAKTAGLVALGALAFGAASKRKKERKVATVVGVYAGVVSLFASKKAMEQ
tara:strand:- start:1418 stop:2110 length:693 start_codon:yes stop_codon:yes gene_type:complete